MKTYSLMIRMLKTEDEEIWDARFSYDAKSIDEAEWFAYEWARHQGKSLGHDVAFREATEMEAEYRKENRYMELYKMPRRHKASGYGLLKNVTNVEA